MPPTATQVAANSASNDPTDVRTLLSTNNDINVAALIVTIIVGILTALEVYLNWDHQRWERQPERRAAANAGDGLENGPHAETHEMQPTNNQLNDGAVVEDRSDGTSADNISDHQTLSSLAEEGIHEPHKMEEFISGGGGDIQGHIADSDHTSQHSDQTHPSNVQPELESDASMPLPVTTGRSSSESSISSNDENIQGPIARRDHESQHSEHTQPPQPGNVQPGSKSDASIPVHATIGPLVSSTNAVADGSSIVNRDGIAKTPEGDS